MTLPNKLLGTAILCISLVFTSCSKENEVKPPITPPDSTGTPFTPPLFKTQEEWTYNLNIYEANVRQFTKEGTFKAFKEHIPRLKELGVGIIWFMPIHPIGEKNKIAPLGSYYSVKDYKKVNPEFGTMDDFKELVNEIHKNGMFVMLDWVANHTAWDNGLTQTNPDYYTKDANGNFMPPAGTNWSDVIDLDYSKHGLRQYMINAMKFWVTEAGVDGFRCDASDMVPSDFWIEANKELKKVYPGIFMLAEADSKSSYTNGFHMTYAWSLHGFKKGFLKDLYAGTKNANDLAAFVKTEQSISTANHYRMYFTSNHDENSWEGTEYEQFGAAAEAFAVFTQTFNGMPLIYTGQEIGLNRRLLFFEKDPVTWTTHPIGELYRKLGVLKKTNKALWNGEAGGQAIRIATSDQEKVYAFKREKDEDGIVVILNLSGDEKTITLGEELQGNFKDVISGGERQFTKETGIILRSWGYLVFERVQ